MCPFRWPANATLRAQAACDRHRPNGRTECREAAAEDFFQSVARAWLEHWQDGKRPRHAAYVKRRMEADILPCLGARPVAAIEVPELVAMTKAIEQRGAWDIAKRALETTGQVFRYAIAHGYVRRNPANETRPSDILKSARKVNYAQVDAKELPNLLRTIEVHQGAHDVYRTAVRRGNDRGTGPVRVSGPASLLKFHIPACRQPQSGQISASLLICFPHSEQYLSSGKSESC